LHCPEGWNEGFGVQDGGTTGDDDMIRDGATELAEADSATEEGGSMDDEIIDDTAVEESTTLELAVGVETMLALTELDETTADELMAEEAAGVEPTDDVMLEDTG
jgi:hypothetical protein